MSTRRIAKEAGWVAPSRLPKGPGGRALCRRCQTEVGPGRRTFCSDACVHEWRLRSDTAYVRREVFKRDHGVCAVCQVDTVALKQEFAQLHGRKANANSWDLRYYATGDYRGWLAAHGIPYGRMTSDWWDADHIVPVVEGGGECGLDNLRTLCLPCHKRVTKELRARLSAAPKG